MNRTINTYLYVITICLFQTNANAQERISLDNLKVRVRIVSYEKDYRNDLRSTTSYDATVKPNDGWSNPSKDWIELDKNADTSLDDSTTSTRSQKSQSIEGISYEVLPWDQYRRRILPKATDKNEIQIQFAEKKTGKIVSIGASGLQNTSIHPTNQQSPTLNRPVKPNDKDMDELLISLESLEKTDDGTLVEVRLTYYEDKVVTQRYFILERFIVPYNIGGSFSPLWVPVGLFSTSFQRTDKGIPFASMPLGLGLGWRFTMSPGFKVGLSAIGNWLIHPSIKEVLDDENSNLSNEGDTQQDTQVKSTDGFNMAAMSYGFLVDINNLIYVGYSYGFDFREKRTNPGSMFVIGIAPSLLQHLKFK